MLRDHDMPTPTTEVFDLTRVTVDECAALVPPFAGAFLDSVAAWTRHGRRRQSRRYTTYAHGPLPTPEHRLLFMLVYLKQHTMHLRHGRLFGMRPSQATPWMPVLLPVLRHTVRTLGDAPGRRVETFRPCLGEEGPPVPLAAARSEAVPAATPDALPLGVMTAPHDPSRAPTIRRNSKRALAGSQSGSGCTTSCCSMPRCASCS